MFERQEGSKNQSGWYEHKETGNFVELIDDPDLGTPLTNAYVNVGYVYVGKEDPRKKVEAETPVQEDKKVSKK